MHNNNIVQNILPTHLTNDKITYRSLSRELGVHVNTAKKYPLPLFQSLFTRSKKLHGVYSELAAYHASSAPSCATYLITGGSVDCSKEFQR